MVESFLVFFIKLVLGKLSHHCLDGDLVSYTIRGEGTLSDKVM